MVRGVPQLEEAVREAVRPTVTEVVRAKQLQLDLMRDGSTRGIGELQRCLAEADGVPDPQRGELLQVATADDISAVVRPDHPAISRQRLLLAAAEGLVDLIAQGVVIGVSSAPTPAEGQAEVSGGSLGIRYQLENMTSRMEIRTELPDFDQGCRLAPGVAAYADAWYLDRDLFIADLSALQLDKRTERSLHEALIAHRRGLYLAAASLMGTASEGAWYAAGERLRHLDDRLGKPLDEDQTGRVVKRVSELLRQVPAQRGEIAGLESQAELLRHLRNYGVHPREDETDHLNRYFSEPGAGLLLLEMYSYLQRLAGAVARRLDVEE